MRNRIRLAVSVVFVLVFTGSMFILRKEKASDHLMERGINENQMEYIKELFKYGDNEDDITNNFKEGESYKEAIFDNAEPIINKDISDEFPYSIPDEEEIKIKLTKEYRRKEREKRIKF
jgi:hypothetical protein